MPHLSSTIGWVGLEMGWVCGWDGVGLELKFTSRNFFYLKNNLGPQNNLGCEKLWVPKNKSCDPLVCRSAGLSVG